MTATEKLRRMLDERGVEWGNIRNDGSESDSFTEWQFDGIDGRATATEWFANENLSITIYRWGLTPEQAIDATLGRGTCKNVGYYIDSTRFKCSACGYNGWTQYAAYGTDMVPRYCPNCGAKVVDD